MSSMIDDPIIRRVHACALAFVPCILWGPPGSGKTARVRAYAARRQLHLERWILSRCEAIDLKPRIYHDGRVVVARPPEIERLGDHGALFLDELNRATREVEGAALDIIDSPPPGVFVIAACNPPTRGQAARSLESAAANRFCHLDVEPDARAFASAQVDGWPINGTELPMLPADFAATDERVARILSSFIRLNPTLLEKEPDNPVQAGRAWPSPRTWEHVRKLHAVCLALDYGAEDTVTLVQGCVGGPGATYLAFADLASQADPEALLRDPSGYSPSRDRVDRTIAELTAITSAVASEFTDDRWKAAWKIVDVVMSADQADAAMVGGDMLTAALRSLAKTAADKAQKMTPTHKLMPKRMVDLLRPRGT